MWNYTLTDFQLNLALEKIRSKSIKFKTTIHDNDNKISDIQLIRQKQPSSAVWRPCICFVQSQSRWKPTTPRMHCFLLIGQADVTLFSRHGLSLAVPQLQTSVRVTSVPKSLYLICAPSEYDQTNECPQRGKGRGFFYMQRKQLDREPLSLTGLPSWRRRNVIGQFQMDKRNEHGFSRRASNELAFIVPPLKKFTSCAIIKI